MARINIEDSLFKDNRFMDLALALGSRNEALGALVSAWIVAQKFWVNSDNGIPRKEWDKQRLSPELITTGFAQDTGDFVYVSGSKEQFGWLRNCSEAGKRGGLKTKEKYSSDPKRTPSGPEASSSFSSSSSSSFSLSSSPSSSKEKTKKGSSELDKPPRQSSITGDTWEAYSQAYEKRWGVKPVRNAKVSSQLSNFVKRLGQEEAPFVAAFYLTHTDAFYVKTMHSIGPMLNDAEKLRSEWKTDRRMTGAVAKNQERGSVYADQLRRIEEGLL